MPSPTAGISRSSRRCPASSRNFDLVSLGAGTRFELWNHLNGSLDAGLPLINQTYTRAHDLLLTFRVWADF